jgi:cell division septation protein DedD
MKSVGRRLPDLMIGVLIVVLALGLGSLLLTQRNRAAVTPALPPAVSEPEASIPAAPGAVATAPSTAPPPAAITAPSAGQAAPSSPAPTIPTPNSPTPTSSVAPPTTPQPDTTAPPVTTPDPSAAPAATPNTTTAPTAPPRSGGAVATSANRTPLRRDYRISLGTFGSVAEATASTAAVRALGYTVYPIDLGSQVVAQVGPFADSDSANAALGDISRAYGSAVVYAPRQSATGASSSPAPVAAPTTTAPAPTTPVAAPAPVTSSPAPAPSTPAPATPGFSAPDSSSPGTSAAPATTEPVTPPEAPSAPAASSTPEPSTATPAAPAPATAPPTGKVSAPAPSGPVYLQVGAFDRQESAQRMVGLLSDLGYNPSVQAPEGKKVTVLIGPFSGDAVLRAESKLNDNGFDHFRVR